jgi:SNF2 family DNA or RNA helicase
VAPDPLPVDKTIPKPGQSILVRNRPAVVRDVRAFSSPTTVAAHAVQVDYLDGWSHPEADQVIWEREVGARVISSLTLPRIGQGPVHPDVPSRLKAFLDSYRWSAINTLLPPREREPEEVRLVAPWHSAVQIEDYQIYPVLKSLLMPRVSLLLADDVGLGKTIEAGLIISELFARRRIQRVLVVCPASLQGQWRDELKDKFHLDFIIIDRDETFRIQRSLGMDSNPWATFPRIITSMDYLRQRDILNCFHAASGGLTGKDQSKFAWHMLVVDEAHNLFPSRFGDDSDRYMMLKQLSPVFEHKLFLTATPHNGYTVSFTGLLELLDPVRFRQTLIMDEHDHEQVQLTMVRRLKSEINRPGEIERFPRREVKAIPVAFAKPEKELFAALRDYRKAALEFLSKVGLRERRIGDFLLTLLTKRLLSSSYAFACTWWQHVEGVQLGEAETDAMDHAVSRAETPVNDDEEKDLRDLDVARQGHYS